MERRQVRRESARHIRHWNSNDEELFTAWTEAHYTGEVAARGKQVYPLLPMYVECRSDAPC